MSGICHYGPLFQNQLQKKQIEKILMSHRARLNDTMRSSKTNYFNSNTYRYLLEDNHKKQYLKDVRSNEINRENHLLYAKIVKINETTPQSHHQFIKNGSLNIYNRKVHSKQVSVQNNRIRDKLIKLKSSISFDDTHKQFTQNRKILGQLSKIQKYRYPKLRNISPIQIDKVKKQLFKQQPDQSFNISKL